MLRYYVDCLLSICLNVALFLFNLYHNVKMHVQSTNNCVQSPTVGIIGELWFLRQVIVEEKF